MERVEVAHIREQGMDLVIIPVDASFERRPRPQQERIYLALQACATGSGLTGTVVPVWEAVDGRMAFLAPPEWHRFFRAIDLGFVIDNINGVLRYE